MKITITLDDLRELIQKSDFVPSSYEITSIEQEAYDRNINIHCRKVEREHDPNKAILGRNLPPPPLPLMVAEDTPLPDTLDNEVPL